MQGPENLLKTALIGLDLFGKTSHHKAIPSQYLLGPPHVRQAMVHGLMDTDGTVGPDGDDAADGTVSDRTRS